MLLISRIKNFEIINLSESLLYIKINYSTQDWNAIIIDSSVGEKGFGAASVSISPASGTRGFSPTEFELSTGGAKIIPGMGC